MICINGYVMNDKIAMKFMTNAYSFVIVHILK